PLAIRNSRRPCGVEFHWKPNWHAPRWLIFLFEKVVISGANPLIRLSPFLFPVPIKVVAPRRCSKRGHYLSVNVFRMCRLPNQGGYDKFERGVNAAAGLVPEPHYGEPRLRIGRQLFRFGR